MTRPESPPDSVRGPRVILRRLRMADLLPMLEAIDTSRDHLAPWMAWAQTPPTEESVLSFLRPAITTFDYSGDVSYGITLPDDTLVGVCSLMPRVGPRAQELGYWVDVRHVGRGIATETVGLLTTVGFALPTTQRLEIHCDHANHRSAAVARRAGFSLDRIEDGAPKAPGHTGRSMIWVLHRDEWARRG